MAYPASSQLLGDALTRISQTMTRVKTASAALRTASASGPVDAFAVLSYLHDLTQFRDQMAAIVSAAGAPLAQYARDAYANQGLDIVSEYNATLAQINATRQWLLDNFPKDAQGNLLERKFDASGKPAYNTFSTASLATFRTQLAALESAIS